MKWISFQTFHNKMKENESLSKAKVYKSYVKVGLSCLIRLCFKLRLLLTMFRFKCVFFLEVSENHSTWAPSAAGRMARMAQFSFRPCGW